MCFDVKLGMKFNLYNFVQNTNDSHFQQHSWLGGLGKTHRVVVEKFVETFSDSLHRRPSEGVFRAQPFVFHFRLSSLGVSSWH